MQIITMNQKKDSQYRKSELNLKAEISYASIRIYR